MTLLVTGADGLVGSALKSELNGQDVVFTNRGNADLTDFDATLGLFRDVRPTRVIHLAALVGGIGGNLMYAGDFFRQNTLINLNVLEAARVTGVNKLASFMSTCIFPNDASYPLTVDQLHLGAPHPSNFGYAYAKRMLEVQSRAYREQWGLDYVVAIPTNIYGPHDNWSLSEGHVVPALIHKTFLAMKSGEPLVVWGSGRPLREFIYSRDVARLAAWLVDEYSSSEPIIFTSGVETPISELVEVVTTAMGFNGDIVFDSSKPGGQFRKPSDPSALHRHLPGFEFTPLNVGMAETVSWFVNNYPAVRK